MGQHCRQAALTPAYAASLMAIDGDSRVEGHQTREGDNFTWASGDVQYTVYLELDSFPEYRHASASYVSLRYARAQPPVARALICRAYCVAQEDTHEDTT